MNQSENIEELAKALVLAQGEMSGAAKDAKNPFFKSDYADLASVMEACKMHFHKNGISVIQGVDADESGSYISSRLLHTSGQWLESRMKLLLDKQNMQGLGSAITYGKRYLLQSQAFIPSVDDDGNAASRTVVQNSPNNMTANDVKDFFSGDPKDYVPTVGFIKGNTLEDTPNKKIEESLAYWESSALKNGKANTGPVKEFEEMAKKYLGK